MKDTLPARVRFGVFNLDLQTGELRQGDSRVLLQQQPFHILRILIEHRGGLATREEIKKKLWPNDTIVEFDHSINVVMGNLRRALGDSAEQPKYIETVARRGYRLMTPVEWVDQLSVASSQLSEPTLAATARTPVEATTLMGRAVSHYRVLEIIGGGGMGVVYRAEDLKLGRRVALKFLPEELGSDPQALERFSREARAASSLNHPNICTIYEFGEHDGQPFLVMELLEGETLRELISAAVVSASRDRPHLPLEKLLDVAIQVAGGLEGAHGTGIIHRDIKPANIFLTSKGVVKILDFGLAKLAEAPDAGVERGFSPASANLLPLSSRAEVAVATEVEGPAVRRAVAKADPSTPCRPDPQEKRVGEQGRHSAQDDSIRVADPTLTRTGVAMGTAGYMSPEQVRGEKLDARTDIFSVGLVLYEMATGQRAFSGETAAVVHDAILNQAPTPLHKLNPNLPRRLEGVITKALEKDRERRYQSAAEIRADLEKEQRGRPLMIPALRESSRWTWLAVAALLLVITITGELYWGSRNTIQLTDNDTVVLADFTNKTSDPVFDDALNMALRGELEQTPFLNLLAPDKVRGTLKQMNHAEREKLTPELARDVCLQTNSKAYLAGSIADAGNRYGIDLRAVNCQTGITFARTRLEARDRYQVVKMLGVAGSDLRRKLGEPEASLQKFNQPLDRATSSSPEALQAFTRGFRTASEKGSFPAIAFYRRAVELDPNFAGAYCFLAAMYVNLSETSLAIQNINRAYELRDRVTQRDRFLIEASYHRITTGDIEEANQITMEWAQSYPRESIPPNNLSVGFNMLGKYQEAAAQAQESLRIEPNQSAAVENLVQAYLGMNRLDEAKAVFEAAQARKLERAGLSNNRYLVAFLEGDRTAMEEQVKWAMGKPGAEDAMLSNQSDSEAYYGHFGKARELSQRAVESASHAALLEPAAGWRANEALREAMVGDARRAREKAREALKMSAGTTANPSFVLTLAMAGGTGQDGNLADKLNQDRPLDTMVQNYWLPSIRAAIELKNNPGQAIKGLQVATPYELGSAGCLHPVYVRGLAYLQAGHGQEASAEFQKVLDHPGAVTNCIQGALAHLQLGRAQAMMGDKEAARKSYQDFLTLWKDADPDIPIYKQAKAEYAKLR